MKRMGAPRRNKLAGARSSSRRSFWRSWRAAGVWSSRIFRFGEVRCSRRGRRGEAVDLPLVLLVPVLLFVMARRAPFQLWRNWGWRRAAPAMFVGCCRRLYRGRRALPASSTLEFKEGRCVLPRSFFWFCSLVSLFCCGSAEELVGDAGDGVPADVLESDLRSCPSGQARSRLLNPLMEMASAAGTRSVLFSSSSLQRIEGWRSTAEGSLRLKTMHCASSNPEGPLCFFFVFWCCLCKCGGAAVVVCSSGLCTCRFVLGIF